MVEIYLKNNFRPPRGERGRANQGSVLTWTLCSYPEHPILGGDQGIRWGLPVLGFSLEEPIGIIYPGDSALQAGTPRTLGLGPALEAGAATRVLLGHPHTYPHTEQSRIWAACTPVRQGGAGPSRSRRVRHLCASSEVEIPVLDRPTLSNVYLPANQPASRPTEKEAVDGHLSARVLSLSQPAGPVGCAALSALSCVGTFLTGPELGFRQGWGEGTPSPAGAHLDMHHIVHGPDRMLRREGSCYIWSDL